MKSNIVIYWMLSIFFYIISATYAGIHYVFYPGFQVTDPDHAPGFWTGTITILLSGILFSFIAFYLQLKRKKQGGELPEDTDTAVLDDADPELGFYSPWSWWPIAVAFCLGLVFLGLAIGWWFIVYSFPLLLISLVGLSYEYSRGNFGH